MLLILPAIMGGSIGPWIAMYVFRHKTKQKRIIFVLGKATKILSHTEYMNKALSDVGVGKEANLIAGGQESREILPFRQISSRNTADFCYFHQNQKHFPEIRRNAAL